MMRTVSCRVLSLLLGISGLSFVGSGCFGNAVYDNVFQPTSTSTTGDSLESGQDGAGTASGSDDVTGRPGSTSTSWSEGSTGVDDGTSTGSWEGCGDSARPEMLMFVTSETFPGDFKIQGWDWKQITGRERGDVLCNCIARDRQLKGRFRAWLSEPDRDMRNVLWGDLLAVFGNTNASFVRSDGACVAESWEGLLDGTLLNPIYRSGQAGIGPSSKVWTGTLPDGRGAGGFRCNGWSGTQYFGSYGVAGATNSEWTAHYSELQLNDLDFECSWGVVDDVCCSQMYNLYCVQVDNSVTVEPSIPSWGCPGDVP